MLCVVQPAFAQRCNDSGRLTYAGRFADESASVWLSRSLLSEARTFRLESAEQGVFSSTFAIPARGLHLSLSPSVSQGNGGVHQLYLNDTNCFVDSQNQKGGYIFGGRPGGNGGGSTGGSGGGFGGVGGTGGSGGGFGGVGGTGGSGGGSGGVGGTGGSGGGTGGVGGTGGSGGGTGGGTTTGTGGTGGGTTTAETGNTGTDTSTDLATSNGGSGGGSNGSRLRLNDLLSFDRAQAALAAFERARSISDRLVLEMFPGTRAALTGRDGGHGWNFWMDSRGVTTDDRCNNRDFYGRQGDFYAGLDYRPHPNLIIGLTVGGEFWSASEFAGTLRSSSDTFVVGPYAAFRLNNWLMLDGWLGYAVGSRDIMLAGLQGDRNTTQLFGSVNLTAQAWVEGWRFRPKLSAYFADANAAAFSLVAPASMFGTSVAVPIRSQRDGMALADASVEVAYPLRVADNVVVIPNLRPGIMVAMNRANGGRVATGTLDVSEVSRASGTLRAGLQVNVGARTALEVSGGYLSIG